MITEMSQPPRYQPHLPAEITGAMSKPDRPKAWEPNVPQFCVPHAIKAPPKPPPRHAVRKGYSNGNETP